MRRPRYQPSLLNHLSESGFLLWLFCIAHSIIFSFVLSSELGDLLRNEFFPLLILATIIFLANMYLAGLKYGEWLAYCDRSQKAVLITLMCYEFLMFFLRLSLFLMPLAIVFIKFKDS